MLLALSVVDWNTQYIPVEYTGVVLICGLIRLFADVSNWWEYVIGLIAVSGFLYIVNIIGTRIAKRRYGDDEIDGVIGDGDIKLMAATGLLLGWKLNFLALGIGCIIGSIIHIILMKVKGSERKLALGPYLSLGVYITMICGEQLVGWYLNMVGFNSLQ
jgi:leader peptidase (prepilin peptidase)/N-methyltransferase